MPKRLARSLSLTFLSLVLGAALRAQPLPPADAAEIQLALKKLTVLGSVLHIAAHPDDENTAFLAYCSKGRLVRSAYLSTTRGEGGQNLIGPEQGELLGVIRTQELLAARRVDGAEQYFTSAVDFGYSKSPEEALRIWDRNAILSDMVWVIRNFRPDVIVTRFTPTIGTHGHHTASAILAREAFDAAGDPLRFPEQLRSVRPWKPARLLFNYSTFFGVPFDTAAAIRIDVGAYHPLLGRSFTELSGMGRTMHKSQGFGSLQNRGANVQYFLHTAGDSARGDLFAGIDMTWSRIPGGAAVGSVLEKASASYRPYDPAAVLPLLLEAYRLLSNLEESSWKTVKRRELTEAIRLCAGIWVDALAAEPSVMPGSSVAVNVSALTRSAVPVRLERIATSVGVDTSLGRLLSPNAAVSVTLRCLAPAAMPLSQPYWLRVRSDAGHYHLSDPAEILAAENPPAITAELTLSIDATPVTFAVPVQYRWADPVEGEMYRPLSVAPPVTLELDERNYVFGEDAAKPVRVTLRSGAADTRGTVSLRLPDRWSADPPAPTFAFARAGEETTVTFSVRPGRGAGGRISAAAQVGGVTCDRGMTTIRYPHIPAQTLFPPAEANLLRIDVRRARKHLGYIMGSGDGVPSALRQIGYDVTLLDDDDLAGMPLASFDAVIAGVRAYNTRPALVRHQGRLMEYVRNGGTYVVQYVTPKPKESDNIGPAPLNVSRERVSVEDAPVAFLNPEDPLLSRPNIIAPEDFAGWVQERGLSFADKWDPAFRPVLSLADPGEPPREGGLLVAKHGGGVFVYTGLSFFRQLPEGVPGAYRLFVNLVEARP